MELNSQNLEKNSSASVSRKSIDSPNQYTKDTIQSTLTMKMPQQSKQKSCLTSISSLEDFLANLSVLEGIDSDSMTQEELSFLKSLGFSRIKDQDIFYSKMLGIYYLTIKETPSRQLLGFSPNWGILYRGRYIIAEIMEFHRTENEYSLLDVLEGERESYEILFKRRNCKKEIDGRVENGWIKLKDNLSCTTTRQGDFFAITTRFRCRPFKKRLDNYVLDEYGLRKLSPCECEMLQGFPKGWTALGKYGEEISDVQRYKCIGNAVTTNVVRDIINEVFKDYEDG